MADAYEDAEKRDSDCGKALKNSIDDDTMCCIKCGHIAKDNEPYETYTDDDFKDYPICPNCEEWNIGGFDSFAPACVIAEENMAHILELNNCAKG